MLILTRRPGDQIHIGKDISITITQVKGKHVKIGINAPKDVDIKRDDYIDPASLNNRSSGKYDTCLRGE